MSFNPTRDNLRQLNADVYFTAARRIADFGNEYSCIALSYLGAKIGSDEREAWEAMFGPGDGDCRSHPFWNMSCKSTSPARAERVIALTMMGNIVKVAKASRGVKKKKSEG